MEKILSTGRTNRGGKRVRKKRQRAHGSREKRKRTEKLVREGKERERERGGRKRKSERKGAGQVSA